MERAKTRLLLLALVLAVVAGVVFAAGRPWTHSACYRWAAEQGVEEGIRVAYAYCEVKFGPLDAKP